LALGFEIAAIERKAIKRFQKKKPGFPRGETGPKVARSQCLSNRWRSVSEEVLVAAESQPAGSISWRHLGWYRHQSLDHLLSTRSYPISAAMPKDAAYFELLVKSRRVRRDTSSSIIVARLVKIKSEIPQFGSRDFHAKFTGNNEQK
jgi:hypothetical protein